MRLTKADASGSGLAGGVGLGGSQLPLLFLLLLFWNRKGRRDQEETRMVS